jgi:hypothetical protein
MLRVVQLLASVALLTAIAVAVADAIRYAAGDGPQLRSVFAWWLMAEPNSLVTFQGFVERALGPALWDPVMLTILSIPAALVFALKGFFLFLMVVTIHSPSRG